MHLVFRRVHVCKCHICMIAIRQQLQTGQGMVQGHQEEGASILGSLKCQHRAESPTTLQQQPAPKQPKVQRQVSRMRMEPRLMRQAGSLQQALRRARDQQAHLW